MAAIVARASCQGMFSMLVSAEQCKGKKSIIACFIQWPLAPFHFPKLALGLNYLCISALDAPHAPGQLEDSPWVRQFQVFQADHEVPADPEDQRLLSLLGNHAHPVQQHIQGQDGQSAVCWTICQPIRCEVKLSQCSYSGSSCTSSSTLSGNTLE